MDYVNKIIDIVGEECSAIDIIDDKYYAFMNHPDLVYIIDKSFNIIGSTSLIELLINGVIKEDSIPDWKRD